MSDKQVDLITISINRDALDRLKSGAPDPLETEKTKPQICAACPFYVYSDEWSVTHCILFGKDVDAQEAKAKLADFCKLDWVIVRYKGG